MQPLTVIGALPPWIRYTLQAGTVALIGLIDHVTGPEIALSILYLIPVASTAWLDGGRAGVVIGVCCGAVWLAADLSAGHVYSSDWIPVWNASVRSVFFVVVAHLLARLRHSQAHILALSRSGALTGLWNAGYFQELASREIERCRRASRPASLAYLDVDDFKLVNDGEGHGAGDAVLALVGSVLRRSIRAHDVAGRVGGDEFAMLLPEAHLEEASVVVHRAIHAITKAMSARPRPVTLSVGALTFAAPLPPLADMMRAADAMMYEVKRSGKGAVRHELAPPAAA